MTMSKASRAPESAPDALAAFGFLDACVKNCRSKFIVGFNAGNTAAATSFFSNVPCVRTDVVNADKIYHKSISTKNDIDKRQFKVRSVCFLSGCLCLP